ncbi:hypothetical protein ETB97_009016 [Aspergillus alliaceus]|uniref:Uncharacterized protein n=1 Tax=Petromyces alliaceus TaxID=209559 RepID=A0A8H6E8Y2_PETAA|nr:hypothetical protein ETB97_009016 [Aspergillus burnettii]
MSLRAPYLLTVASLLLAMAIALQVLRQYSDRVGFLVRYKRTDDLPTTVSVVYTNVPTVIALVAVNLWEVCACDVRRLEPYFQLAKPQGASASVLFTNYCFCYGIFAPITAARNRHWIVFCVTLVSLVVRMFLPSLLSGLVVMSELNTVDPKTVETWPDLVNLQTQEAWMTAEASYPRELNPGNDHVLSRSSEYAVPPVSMPVEDQNDSSVLSLNQTVYWANLTCIDTPLHGIMPTSHLFTHITDSWQAVSLNLQNISIANPSDQSPGCSVNMTLNSVVPTEADRFQLRYWEPSPPSVDSNITSAFYSSDCDSFTMYGVVAEGSIMSNSSIGMLNATVFACRASYQYAEAEVLIASNTSIIATRIHPGAIHSLSRDQFSISKFEDLMHTKYHSKTTINTSHPVEVRVASSFIDIENYQREVRDLWNRSFLRIMNKIFNPNTSPTLLHAQQASISVVLKVISTSSIHAETMLWMASCLLFSLSLVYPRRPNFLRSDPSSIATQCAIAADLFSPTVVLARLDTDFHRCTTRQLRQWAKGLWCQWQGEPKDRRLGIVSTDGRPVPLFTQEARRKQDLMPHFLTLPWFILECSLFVAILVLFGIILRYLCIQDLNAGSKVQASLLILMLFVPNIVASAVSVFLASVLRHLSALEPWVQLQNGPVTATQSLLTTYGSQTPFAVFWKCIRRGPPLLAVLSLVCILGLLLSIISGGLFEPQIKQHSGIASSLFTAYDLSTFARPLSVPVLDSYSLLSKGIATDTLLVPWTVTNYSFVPIFVDEPESERTSFTASTRGIGADLTCDYLPANHSWIDRQSGNTYWHYEPFGNRTESNCTVEVPGTTYNYVEKSIHFATSTNCETPTVLVLARWKYVTGAPASIDNTLALHCEPTIRMQDFVVQFDHFGQVESYQPIPGSSITGGDLFQNASDVLRQYNRAFAQAAQTTFPHPDSFLGQYDWPGFFTAQAYESLNPKSSWLDPADLVIAVQSTYRAVFSTYFTLWRDLYLERLPQSHSLAVDGTVTRGIWGLLPSTPSIVIVIILLSLDILMIVGIFVARRGRFNGPRIPKSIGSLIPWIAHSQMMGDFEGTQQWNEVKLRQHLEGIGHKYRLGTARCADGISRIAVDYQDDGQHFEMHGNRTTGLPSSSMVAAESALQDEPRVVQ